jgi:ATP-dependent RNA helicase RhlE
MSSSSSTSAPGFTRFGLDESLLRGIAAAGFESPRPIQAQTIPASIEGRDVLGLAQTGTGKTAAFALPMMQRILQRSAGSPLALVLAPTRELATQISEEIAILGQFAEVRVVTIYGGVSQRPQVEKLRKGADVVVACPGRLLDLLQQGHLDFSRVDTCVLDEADHMFDMGFLPDIRRILAALPAQRQNLLFSATMPPEIRRLANNILNSPHVVELAHSAPAATIEHALYPVAEGRKRELLEHLLAGDSCESAIVFTRTKHRARRLAEQLGKAGYRAVGLQGNLSQGQRDKAMRGFRDREYDILVATDIAARGIDVSNVSHVINFDVPNTADAYTHRIGRTGRSEQSGIACTFVTSGDRAWIRATERKIGHAIRRHRVDGFDLDPSDAEKSAPPRGRGGHAKPKSAGQPNGRKPRRSRRRNKPGERHAARHNAGGGPSRRRRRRRQRAAGGSA